jgi:hypothetical protein
MKITIFFTILSLAIANFSYANEENITNDNNVTLQEEKIITEKNTPKIEENPIPQLDINNDIAKEEVTSNVNNETQQYPMIENPSNIAINPENNTESDKEYDQEIQKEIIKNMFGAKSNPELTEKLEKIENKLDEVTIKINSINSNKDNKFSEELRLLILAIVGICFILFIITITTLLKLSKLNKLLLRASQ